MQKKAIYTFFIFLIGFAFSTYATETKLIIRVRRRTLNSSAARWAARWSW
ncbi:MAG: hypothetical protein ACE5I1_04295 [bacterium]